MTNTDTEFDKLTPRQKDFIAGETNISLYAIKTITDEYLETANPVTRAVIADYMNVLTAGLDSWILYDVKGLARKNRKGRGKNGN